MIFDTMKIVKIKLLRFKVSLAPRVADRYFQLAAKMVAHFHAENKIYIHKAVFTLLSVLL